MAELRYLVCYCLLLTVVNNLYRFYDINVPREPRFTGVLVELSKRQWEDERFETLYMAGVLPNNNDVWD